MNLKHLINICAVMLGCVLCLHTTAATAELVTSDQLVPSSQIEAEKLKIQVFMDRAEVRDRLQTLGVIESMSNVRVDAMTDAEVHAMAQKIDTMPAGGRLRDSDLVVILLIVLLLLLI